MTNTCNIWSIFIYLPNKLSLRQMVLQRNILAF